MSDAKQFVIATAGHVDHGKSALVKALTGTDPDRLPEEKARQITIDLGFAELSLPGPGGELIHAAMVDVPGHEDFVRNMIAGVGSIDLALLVVAADDGWMPQTEEHLQILEYLGVAKAVIVLTKSDLGNADTVAQQIRDQLRDTFFRAAQIVRTSLHHKPLTVHDGVPELKHAIAVELARISPQRDIGKPRLFVDRAFSLRGIGTVVTGTLTGGTFHRGDPVLALPRKRSAHIRSLQSHGRDVDLAVPGMRAALNLPELEPGTQVLRGDMVTVSSFEPSGIIGVLLTKSSRSDKRPVKNRSRVYLHHGTSRIAASIRLFGKDSLRPGDQAIAQLRIESPVAAFLGDRFVLRDPSERFTIAGGVVLDPHGELTGELLQRRAGAPNDIDVCVRTGVQSSSAVLVSALLHQSHFHAAEIEAAVQRLQIPMRNGFALDERYWNSLREKAVDLIDRVHQGSPDKFGVEISELRGLFPQVPPELVNALIEDLCAKEFARAGSGVARKTHRAALPSALRGVAERIIEQITSKPFDPPARKLIAPDAKSQQTVRFLVDNGDVVELGPDIILSADSFKRMREFVVEFIAAKGPATVSVLRQELQTSRRIMVPFLERLDRDRVTRRFGDKRKLADEILSQRALK